MRCLLPLVTLAAVANAACFIVEDAEGVASELCVDDGAVTVSATNATSAATAAVGALATDLDTTWIIVCGALVMFMQAGFGILEAGSVAEKNVVNIMFKNVMDACIAAVAYWLFGYAFAYGTDGGKFIGGSNFALGEEDGTDYHSFFFQWAFAATAATIVAGSVAERCKLEAYLIYSVVITAFIYPVVSHWIWADGWLTGGEAIFGGNGMVDFAGCAVVHMVGGFAGLVAAIVIGPRVGRFDGSRTYEPHNQLFCALGVFFLWFGWYGFNCGSTLGVSGGASVSAGRVAMTTTISAGAGGFTACFFGRVISGKWDLLFSLNGILAGLVSITSAPHCVEPWAAFLIGVIGAFVYKGASFGLQKLKIDDPLDAAPVHGACGMWGALTPGIFGVDALINEGTTHVADGTQFLTNLVGVLAVAAWTLATSAILFLSIKYTVGLRVDAEIEAEGLDASEHGARAYVTSEDLVLKKRVDSVPKVVEVAPKGGESAESENTVN